MKLPSVNDFIVIEYSNNTKRKVKSLCKVLGVYSNHIVVEHSGTKIKESFLKSQIYIKEIKIRSII